MTTEPEESPDRHSERIPDNATGELAKLAEAICGTLPQDILGVLGADWLHEVRCQNLTCLRARTEEILNERNVRVEDRKFNPSIAIPLIAEAQDQTDDGLQKLWSQLLATAVDGSTAHLVRRLYVDTLKHLDPLDVRVLFEIFSSYPIQPSWTLNHTVGHTVGGYVLEEKLGVSYNEIIVSFERLAELGCIKTGWFGTDDGGLYAQATYLGNGLRSALMPHQYPLQNLEPKRFRDGS